MNYPKKKKGKQKKSLEEKRSLQPIYTKMLEVEVLVKENDHVTFENHGKKGGIRGMTSSGKRGLKASFTTCWKALTVLPARMFR